MGFNYINICLSSNIVFNHANSTRVKDKIVIS